MQRFTWRWVAIAVLVAGFTACANEGVGDPCIPEDVPCKDKVCGFGARESFLEASSVQCRSRVCIVHKLDRGDGRVADPREDCAVSPGPNCVTASQLNESVYCTCRCKDGDGKKIESCECASGFKCEEILSLGGNGLRGSYCVKPPAKL